MNVAMIIPMTSPANANRRRFVYAPVCEQPTAPVNVAVKLSPKKNHATQTLMALS
jgi:hypothetical protein